jgi:hypothetical protein
MKSLLRRHTTARRGEKGRKIQSETASGTEGLRRSSLVRVFGIGDRDGRKSVSLAGVISLGLALRG